jgi:lipoprotein-releasing system ATP-binding protein
MNNTASYHQEYAYVVQCVKVVKTFQDAKNVLKVLNGVDLQVKRGEQVAIIGRSGSGKTTLLQVLSGLDMPSSGQICINGYDLSAMSEHQKCNLRNKMLGFVYQQHHLLPEFSALENVAMPLLISGVAPKAARKEAIALLDEVGLSYRREHRPGALSGGERQRVAIARALVMHPSCVFADEPTGNLDSDNAKQALRIMQKISASRGTAFVVVTHDLELAKSMDRICHLKNGVLE